MILECAKVTWPLDLKIRSQIRSQGLKEMFIHSLTFDEIIIVDRGEG